MANEVYIVVRNCFNCSWNKSAIKPGRTIYKTLQIVSLRSVSIDNPRPLSNSFIGKQFVLVITENVSALKTCSLSIWPTAPHKKLCLSFKTKYPTRTVYHILRNEQSEKFNSTKMERIWSYGADHQRGSDTCVQLHILVDHAYVRLSKDLPPFQACSGHHSPVPQHFMAWLQA